MPLTKYHARRTMRRRDRVIQFFRLLVFLSWFCLPAFGQDRDRTGSIIEFPLGPADFGDGVDDIRGSNVLLIAFGLQTEEESYKLRGLWKTDVLLGADCSDFVREFGKGLLVCTALNVADLIRATESSCWREAHAKIDAYALLRVILSADRTEDNFSFPIEIHIDGIRHWNRIFVPKNLVVKQSDADGLNICKCARPKFIDRRDCVSTFVFYDTRKRVYRYVRGNTTFYSLDPWAKFVDSGYSGQPDAFKADRPDYYSILNERTFFGNTLNPDSGPTFGRFLSKIPRVHPNRDTAWRYEENQASCKALGRQKCIYKHTDSQSPHRK